MKPSVLSLLCTMSGQMMCRELFHRTDLVTSAGERLVTESAVLVADGKDQAAALTVNFYCFAPLCIKQSRHHSLPVAV